MIKNGISAELQHTVEQFFYHEARLLSEGHFEEWLDLLSDDIFYWMPVRETLNGYSGSLEERKGMSIFEDDKAFLASRIERLRSSSAFAEQPPSRLRYFISNVEISQITANEYNVWSNILVYQSRSEHSETIYAGRREDRLRQFAQTFEISQRKIMLEHSVVPRVISFFF